MTNRYDEKRSFIRHMKECFPDMSEKQISSVATSLYRSGTTLARLYEISCSVEMNERQQANHDLKESQIEDRVTKILQSLSLKFEFNGDPRGYAIKIKLPNNKSNSWCGNWGI